MSKRDKPEGVSEPSERVPEGSNETLTPVVHKRDAPAIVIINNPAFAKLLNVKPGVKIPVACKNGVPLSREWRNRFRDSKIDKCIAISQNVGKPKVPSKKEGK